MSGGAHERNAAFLLRVSKRGGQVCKRGEMLVDVRFGVLHRDGPLLVPPIGLGEDAAVNHAEPKVAPEIDVDGGPVAVVADFVGVKHQSAVDARSYHVSLEPDLRDDLAIAVGELVAELIDIRIVFAG